MEGRWSMSVVRGTYRNGNITLEQDPAWPEDSEVFVELNSNRLGISEEEQLNN